MTIPSVGVGELLGVAVEVFFGVAVRAGVAERFGVVLENEPTLVGCSLSEPESGGTPSLGR